MGLPATDGTCCIPCVLLPLGEGPAAAVDIVASKGSEGHADVHSEPVALTPTPTRSQAGAGLQSVLLPRTPVREVSPGGPEPRQESGEAAIAQEEVQDRGIAIPTRRRISLEEAGMNPGPLEVLDKGLHKAVCSGSVPGLAYAILKDGHVVHAQAFGVTDVETRQPWRFDTLCRIYSMTKSVTICGFMRLVEDGLVAVDDPVSKYLPAFAQHRLKVVPDDSMVHAEASHPAPRTEMTIKHLLTHTSGLSQGPVLGDDPSCATEEAYKPLVDQVDAGSVSSLAQWCDELAKLPLRFQPGDRWEYSYGMDVLGRIIEVVTGKRLDTFLHEQVLGPLRMDDTTFALPETKRGRLASFYRRGEDDALVHVDRAAGSRWVEPQQAPVLSAGGALGSVAGGLVSSVDDFGRFLCMLQNGGELDGHRILQEETIRSMYDNLLPSITGRSESWCLDTAGLGFGMLGSTAVSHPEANWYDVPGEFGWGGLAGTAWAVDRGDGLAVVSFCQVMYELWIDEEVRKAARQALGYSADQPQPEVCRGLATTPVQALTPQPRGSGTGAGKRSLEEECAGDETPKRARLSHEAILSQGSSEKLRAEKEGEVETLTWEAATKENSDPFFLPLPERRAVALVS